ncbi:uncharacterized protein PFL1_00227 [Pseudozyma flocculosa PF-1]|uniref:Related to Tubulin-specific chaperone B n=1 Tax=Pseudozyma flocculosa TaxID=84751 RepID=A0A5C3ETR0_9BASI|nr:uncharacterized protein PFL1_00227 [Pseudozyma flocculosa PF-1]EPQ32029.1 hypothetical protein PFL1_00227 [Pseudozyma flocculosa PF-1]SPO35045.1 related to Tubulin-specific chaperone B [Pseudozyma flocculosa]
MSVLNLFIHAPSTLVSSERRLPSSIPLHDLKHRLEPIVGVPPSNQILEIHTSRTDDATSPSRLYLHVPAGSPQEAQSLLDLGVEENWAIKVLDTRPKELVQTYTDESLVEKYEMDDDTYAKRRDTVLAYKQRNKLGRFDPKAEAASIASKEEEEKAIPPGLKPGARCAVDLAGGAAAGRRGTVRFVGPTKFAAGIWVGVEYDEPVGKNDGSVAGERYFACRNLHGSFVKPDKVTVGDFPEEDIDDLLDDDDEEM